MKLEINNNYLVKDGNTNDEYEDSFAPKFIGIKETKQFNVSVTDGASESSFASDWAKMLARSYAKTPFNDIDSLSNIIRNLSSRWFSVHSRTKYPWYVEEKINKGAFSAFLGLSLIKNSYSAIAIGDCCLFQVRDNKLVKSFPITEVESFGNTPFLISSNLVNNNHIWDNVRTLSSSFISGDIFILASDAFSQWFLYENIQGNEPWETIFNMFSDGKSIFEEWIISKRKNNEIKNDDITVYLIKVL